MGRPPRNFPAGTIVHAYNRGVEHRTIFNEAADYAAFINVVREGSKKDYVRIFGYCVMPNHWHFVMQAAVDNGISRFMHWLTNTHVKRYRGFRASTGDGHLYQDRYKSPVIEGEEHFLTAMRYVETNAAVAGLADTAEEWVWGSAYERSTGVRRLITDPPGPLPADWSQQLADYVKGARHRDGARHLRQGARHLRDS